MGGVAGTSAIQPDKVNRIVGHGCVDGLEPRSEVVQDIECLGLAALKFLVHHRLKSVNFCADRSHNVGVRKSGAEFEHMALVVQKLALFLGARNGRELTAADSVPRAYNKCLFHHRAGADDQLSADAHHRRVYSFGVASHFQRPFLVDVSEACELVCARDSHLVEHNPAIVLCIVAKLAAKVAHLYARHMLVSRAVANLH